MAGIAKSIDERITCFVDDIKDDCSKFNFFFFNFDYSSHCSFSGELENFFDFGIGEFFLASNFFQDYSYDMILLFSAIMPIIVTPITDIKQRQLNATEIIRIICTHPAIAPHLMELLTTRLVEGKIFLGPF